MKIRDLILKAIPALFVVAGFVFSVATSHAADGRRKNPTSKLYVADIDGLSSINTGDKIEDLTKKSVYAAEGVVIETDTKSNNALVLSNGTGVSFDPDTRLEMNRFMQEPFSPNRTDLDMEPSISQTAAFIPRGTIGLCTSKMIAGSTMTYKTAQATISIRGRKVVIEATDNQTCVSLIEGDVTVRGDLMSGGESLKPGQQAIITRKSPTSPPTIKIQDIPDGDKDRLGSKVAIACMARKTVYFQVSDRKSKNAADNVFSQNDDNPQNLVPVEIVPRTLPPQITVSPYTIPAPTPAPSTATP